MTLIRVIVHQPECPLGHLQRVWTDLGCTLDVIEAWHQPVPESIDDADALVVMGGTQNCLDDDVWGWLPAVRQLIRSSVSRETPFLGVCLGLQLATVALGGEVGRSDHVTLGMTPVGLLDEGREDPLVGGLAGSEAIHFNDDIAVSLPTGATRLATDPTGQPQAVRFAPRAWGVQFHPEADQSIFDGWLRLSETSGWQVRASRETALTASQQIGAADSALADVAADLGRRFLAVVEAPTGVRVA
ncbi:type 1 glutamine amidotransferase [Acidipropionibacterium jensenii]|uniref:type 1 glutamine amidotransferase n=1 Tax=Acidipropionibacterium jensenii TaxID=1749 RepID=UPI00110BF5F4|nr:type 1 glutamine amidotransferase [Acidipropionibacterium jensenii]QCV87755.1 type 1 glutamine amidotransferase [Acidipropionibacterium jensenii]